MSNRFEEKDFSQDGFNFSTWKKIAILFKPQYKNFFILIGLQILIAFSDVLFPYLNSTAIDTFASDSGSSQLLYGFIILYLVAIVLVAILNYVYFHYSGKVEMGFGYDLRKKCFDKLQSI